MRVDQIKKDIGSKVKIGLDASGEDVKELFKNVLYNDYYGAYEPEIYDRKEQIQNAIDKTSAVSHGSGGSVKVYYDSGKMSHPNPDDYGQNGEHLNVGYSEEEILDAVMLGYHMVGMTGRGALTANTWFRTLAEFDKQKHVIIPKELRAAGLPIH